MKLPVIVNCDHKVMFPTQQEMLTLQYWQFFYLLYQRKMILQLFKYLLSIICDMWYDINTLNFGEKLL